MKNKLFIFFIVLSILTFVSANSADANCERFGKVYYIYMDTMGGPSYVYITLSTTLPTSAYYFRTGNPYILQMLSTAMAAGHTVYIEGAAQNCPTTGAFRFGGDIMNLRIYKNR